MIQTTKEKELVNKNVLSNEAHDALLAKMIEEAKKDSVSWSDLLAIILKDGQGLNAEDIATIAANNASYHRLSAAESELKTVREQLTTMENDRDEWKRKAEKKAPKPVVVTETDEYKALAEERDDWKRKAEKKAPKPVVVTETEEYKAMVTERDEWKTSAGEIETAFDKYKDQMRQLEELQELALFVYRGVKYAYFAKKSNKVVTKGFLAELKAVSTADQINEVLYRSAYFIFEGQIIPQRTDANVDDFIGQPIE